MQASDVLARAKELDKKKRFTEAAIFYQKVVDLLLNDLKKEKHYAVKKGIREKIEKYSSRAEILKKAVEQKKGKAGKFHEEIQIDDDSTGHSYERTFGRFLDKSVHCIEVDDPYIRINHQILNFLRFCELVIKRCPSLKTIVLTTGHDEKSVDQQRSALKELKGSLLQYRVNLTVHYSSTLHDRAIRLDSGCIIKIGRGLDYFKPTKSKYSIGYCEMDFRKCHQTTINIFH